MNEQQIFEFDSRRQFRKYLNADYHSLPDEMKRKVMLAWRAEKSITIEKVKKAIGISEPQYYEEIERLGIEKRNKAAAQKKQKLASEKKPLSSCGTSFFKGEINPKQLEDELTRIGLSIDESAHLYRYSIELEKLSE